MVTGSAIRSSPAATPMQPFGTQPRPIGHYLAALVVVAIVPLSLIVAVLVARQASVQRHSIEQGIFANSRAVSAAVDLTLEAHRAALEALSQSGLIDQHDWGTLYVLAKRVAEQRGAAFISLFDQNGTQIFNTARPFGSALPTPFVQGSAATNESPPVGDTSSLKRVLKTGQPGNSDLFISLATAKAMYTVDVPVVRGGATKYVINIGLEPATISHLLRDYARLNGMRAVVVDRNGFIVGRMSEEGSYTAHKVPSGVLATFQGAVSGGGAGDSLEGVPLVYGFSRSASSGWTTSVGVERASIDSPVQTAWLVGGAMALIGLSVSLLLALALARRLRSSVVSLANSAIHGTQPNITGLRTREIVELESTLKAALLTREREEWERGARVLAERESQAKDEFLAMLGHELRNPLAAVSSASEILSRDPAVKGHAANAVSIIVRQTRTLARLLDDLLEVGRFVTGKIVIRPARVDLAAVAGSAVGAARAAGQLAGHTLALETSAVWVNADPSRMEQVAGNLLTNAFKYTPEGGKVSINVCREGEDAILSVSDDGMGIDAELLPRIFDIFVQGERSLDRAKGGLGIGLTVVRRIVELHGGTVSAESRGPGLGSRFEVRLPAADGTAVGTSEEPTGMIRTRDVLIVEDNADAREMLVAALKLSGHRLRDTADGEAALKSIAERVPEIAFIDIGLPGMDGYELVRRIREQYGDAVFLVAISGYGLPIDKARSEAAGFDRHLVKPVTMTDLVQVLASVP